MPKKLSLFIMLIFLTAGLNSCYFVDFFKDSKGADESGSGSDSGAPSILGQSLGTQAGTKNDDALETVYSATSTIPPASIRADPDLYARRLLLQYRPEGSTVAREIGSIEGFRLLLGGASEDFQRTPQENYDATSLLANLSVAEIICEGLVAPNDSRHKGWTTILPHAPSEWEKNFRFLAQRFLGKPSTEITDDQMTSLKNIMDSWTTSGSYSLESYIPVCTALAMDAESLLL